MEQKIITDSSASGLNQKISEMIAEGWVPVGSHAVVEKNHQLRYAGMQHKDTTILLEYSQTMRKEK
jgi:hypothetical protein